MLAKRIIPCLDIKDGRVVKGIQFINLRDAGDPVEQAQIYNDAGADELVFLDISASIDGRKTTADIVTLVSDQVFMPLTVGGGIKTIDDMRRLLLAGADKISINTAAVNNPQLIKEGAYRFGSQCIIIAVDARKTGKDRWEIITYGGRKATGLDAMDWIKQAVDLGAGEVLLTSMDADGTLGGYDLALTKKAAETVNVPIIASGGAGKPEDFAEVLTQGKADAALAASLFHDNKLRIPELKTYLSQRNIPVRLST
jgi:imidazole glycerol-phosphate synthase subunit HisF